jgi:Fur family ferric uptake transcriptional regulator
MVQKIRDILHDAGLKHTAGREALLQLLMASDSPLTQEEISQKISGTGLNRVSIYRALEAFLSAGLIHRLESGDRVWKFAFCGCGQPGHCHAHFICRSCGLVECLDSVKIPALPVKSGYTVEEREFYLKGVCAKCR